MWNIIVLRQLFISETTHQQKYSPRWPWSCWRRDQAGWGSSVGEAPHWAPRSTSSGPRSSAAGPWWGGSVSLLVVIWVTWANHFVVYGCKYNVSRQWVQLGRGRGTRSNGFWQTLPFGALAPTSLLVAALKTDHAKTKSDAGRLCKKKPNVFHSLLFCPFKHLGIALLVNG